MRTGFFVMYGEEKGGMSGNLRGIFTNEDDAKRASKGFGFWGSDGIVLPIKIYDSYEDYENNK